MCTTCGCEHHEATLESQALHVHHQHDDHHSHAFGTTEARIVQIEQDILSKNNNYAEKNRHSFEEKNVAVFNLVSSPGSGKTTLLTRTINDLKAEKNIAVIEGDQQTSQDADRIRKTGVDAVQLNTGKGCHLDAHMVGHALELFNLEKTELLFVENVGNLVCPAAFDLGEAAKVVILSVTEGEDKPLKYPDIFHASTLLLLNKVDLLPYLDFDVMKCIEYARRVNPDIEVVQVSASSGEGMAEWYRWLDRYRVLRGKR